MKKVCVPINSPAWKKYLLEGWKEVDHNGQWVTMTKP